MDDNINIEDIFIFNNNILYNYKDNLFYQNIRELALLYNIRYLINNIICLKMNITEQTYNIKLKNELIEKINFVLIYIK